MFRYLTAVVLGVSLLAPAINAQDHDRDHDRDDRDHAREHRIHEWNEHEREHWHAYLKERHRRDHEWERASKREQREYWKWRDEHPDFR